MRGPWPRPRSQEGFTTIVAAGGDGTVNEVVNGIAGADVALGILPVGTMNVFAAELGLPGDLDEAWAIIQAGRTRRVDLLRANQQYFVQLAGVGPRCPGRPGHELEFQKEFRSPQLPHLRRADRRAESRRVSIVEADDQVREGSFVLIGNGRYYGGPLAFFKDARIDDGKLDVLIFKNLAYLDIARYVTNVFIGKHTDLPDVEYFQTKRAIVRSDEDVPVEVDGEVVGHAAGHLPHFLAQTAGRRARRARSNRKDRGARFPILQAAASRLISPRMRPSRRQMQPFVRRWQAGRTSATALVVALSVGAYGAQFIVETLFSRSSRRTEILRDWLALDERGDPERPLVEISQLRPAARRPGATAGQSCCSSSSPGANWSRSSGARHFAAIYVVGQYPRRRWPTGRSCAAQPLMGVSAGVAAVIVAYTTILPELEVTFHLLFVIPVRLRAKHLAWALLAVSGRVLVRPTPVSEIGPGGHGRGRLLRLGLREATRLRQSAGHPALHFRPAPARRAARPHEPRAIRRRRDRSHPGKDRRSTA